MAQQKIKRAGLIRLSVRIQLWLLCQRHIVALGEAQKRPQYPSLEWRVVRPPEREAQRIGHLEGPRRPHPGGNLG